MFINSIGHYLPETVISNHYFHNVNGLSHEWILSRTGIAERRKANPHENTNTMAIESVKAACRDLPYSIHDVDLIIGATYTPYDTLGTLAHCIQKEFNIKEAKVLTISSACSSFINALEIVQGYFFMGKAKKAIIICSEHNSAYNNYADVKSGHLWGDGAGAVFLSKSQLTENDFQVVDVITKGLGHIGKSIEGVSLFPLNGGIKMPFGSDVYLNAKNHMSSILVEILNKNHMSIHDVDYIIPHQANLKIIRELQKRLQLSADKVIVNIDKVGNTGSASTIIALSQNLDKFKKGNVLALTVFGGGYSCGSSILKKQ